MGGGAEQTGVCRLVCPFPTAGLMPASKVSRAPRATPRTLPSEVRPCSFCLTSELWSGGCRGRDVKEVLLKEAQQEIPTRARTWSSGDLHSCHLLSFQVPSTTPDLLTVFPNRSPLQRERKLRLPTGSLGWPDSISHGDASLLTGKIRNWQLGPQEPSSFYADNSRERKSTHKRRGPSGLG